MKKETTQNLFRTEHDSLGEMRVPKDAYYGIQTMRASENFTASGLRPKKDFITATAVVKRAACAAAASLGLLDKAIAACICRAADEIIAGKHHDEFIVDVYQAGAGTSHNMNANEVIANRALLLMGKRRGDYRYIHPNDHVNIGQSTNDTMPAALRLAALRASGRLIQNLKALKAAFAKKRRAFAVVIKSGRTHLQDAVPVTLGQEFGSYAATISTSIANIESARKGLLRIGLGGTAAGTGINTHPLYRKAVIKELKKITGIRGLINAPDYFEALNSSADFAILSSSVKNLASELVRISNDLRLLSSGPNTGLAEITLPTLQPGSSIMPGKVNPVMAEMLTMAAFQVIGNDLTVTLASGAGQLELNVMLPVINYNLLDSIDILANAIDAFTNKCVSGIAADRARCERYFETSLGLATVLNTHIGYEKAANICKEAAISGRTIKEIVIERGIMSAKEWARLMDVKKITSPTRTGGRR